MRTNNFILEPANIVCPVCGNGNYMFHLMGENVGYFNEKCLNCYSYFHFEELFAETSACKDINATTNADRTDDLLKFAKWVAESVCISDDKWEGDCWAFQEIACRMLVKLGIMEENDGVYSLKQEVDT